jgi:DivIVA domain-containing protein
MEEFTASEVRARSFRLTLRGFDRGEVEDYLEQVAAYVGALLQQLHQAGVTKLESGATSDAAAEYSATGDEVARILKEAREVADAMRSRAAADTAEWRQEAETETRQAMTETEAAVVQARQSAWETSTEMLDEVVAHCEAMLAGATESALLVRSEADRESSRLLTDAQRESEALVRSGREEAERLVSTARRESDKMAIGSRQQTDVAQQRVLALEERRAELMEELEHTQKVLLGIEDAPEQPQKTEELILETKAEVVPRTSWSEGDAVVKIVAQKRSVTSEPVDADALAAEVEALRGETSGPGHRLGSAGSSTPIVSSPGKGSTPRASSGAGSDAASSPQAEEKGGDGGSMPTSSEVDEIGDSGSVSPPGGGCTAEGGVGASSEPGPALEPVTTAESQTTELEPETEPTPDPLAGLFNDLRSSGAAPSLETQGNGSVVKEAIPAQAATAVPAQGDGEQVETRDSPVAARDSIDPFALRDRLLLPVQNRALRLVKRQLVSAQNRALEELRLDESWIPDITLVDGEIGAVLGRVAEESMAAGFAAAAELLGRSDAPQPEIHVDDQTVEFTTVFVEAATLSLERSRSAGAGKRETASSLSRVFRAWRTDDAERRVRFLSRRAYQRGVLDGLRAMDCHQVSVIPSNRSCADCGKGSGPWPIADGPPPGTLIPPASLECSCTVVPAC